MKYKAFTLAELLIVLAILGVIATFTIPKVLQSQQDGKFKAMAKEAAATISEGFRLYRNNDPDLSATNLEGRHILSSLNYVKQMTSGLVDTEGGSGTYDCSYVNGVCYQLHNGGVIYSTWHNFGGSSATHSVWINFDPDGKPSASSRAVAFRLFWNGRITSAGASSTPYCDSNGCVMTPSASDDPAWFSWN